MSVRSDNNARESARWLRTAEADLKSAHWNQNGNFFNTACFQAQQAVEKGLKAFLLAQGERNVRGHSTLELLNRCLPFAQGFTELRRDCRVLDRYYIPTRYPDALPDGSPDDAFDVEDADDAIERAERVISAVKRAIKGSD